LDLTLRSGKCRYAILGDFLAAPGNCQPCAAQARVTSGKEQ
jgi:hypothetical protein